MLSQVDWQTFSFAVATMAGIFAVVIGLFKVLDINTKKHNEATEQFMNSSEGCAVRQAACKEKLDKIESHTHSLDISVAEMKVSMENEIRKVDPNGKLDLILARLERRSSNSDQKPPNSIERRSSSD